MNGLTLLALIAVAIVVFLAYRAGVLQGRREARAPATPFPSSTSPALAVETPSPAAAPGVATRPERPQGDGATPAQDASERLARAPHEAELVQLRAFAEDRRTLYGALADARGELARYRQIVVDIENNAPPPLLSGPGAPDDLRLIVGVGPVLERMLQQLGVSSYRQIARWTERDIDNFDARLPEFHGRVRRDDWVTQARELHLSKYGERP